MASEYYGCFGSGMMGGSYGYGWAIFSWLIGLLAVVGLTLLIVWLFKKIENETNKSKRRKK